MRVVSVTSGIGSGPGGAGPVGVLVKISHRLGVQADARVIPHGSPKRVLDLDGAVYPPPDPRGVYYLFERDMRPM